MDSFIGQVIHTAFNFVPEGRLPCDGRTLPIAQYQALFAVTATQFGGDGKTTFALPDLRARAVFGSGTATIDGVTESYRVGQTGGSTRFTVLPASPAVTVAARADGGATVSVAPEASSRQTTPMPSFTVLQPLICYEGVYPTRA